LCYTARVHDEPTPTSRGGDCTPPLGQLDEAAVAHARKGWNGEFVKRFGIDLHPVEGLDDLRATLLAVQHRQRR